MPHEKGRRSSRSRDLRFEHLEQRTLLAILPVPVEASNEQRQASLTVTTDGIFVGDRWLTTDTSPRAGAYELVKLGAGTLVLDRANSHTGGTVVRAGEVVVRNVAALGVGSVVVNAGATLTLDVGRQAVALGNLDIEAGGRLDVGTGRLVLRAGTFDLSKIWMHLAAGRETGTWSGSSGIASSVAAVTPGRAVGHTVDDDGNLIVGFAGVGDLDMNGMVDVDDATSFVGSGLFDTGLPATWSQGDYDYNGILDLDDVIGFVNAGLYGQGSYLPDESEASIPPTMSDLVLTNDTGVSANDGLTTIAAIRGTTDATGVVRLLATLDPVDSEPTYGIVSAALGPDGTFTISDAQLDALAGGSLSDGQHTVTVVAEKARGIRSTPASIVFTLDRTKPSGATLRIAAADSSDDAGSETAAGTVVLTGATEASARVAVNGNQALAGPSGSFQLPDVAMMVGVNAFDVLVTDAAGNTADAAVSFTLTRVDQAQADPVLEWNAIALRAIQKDVTDPPPATRTLAMVSIAQFDALAAISGTPAFLVQQAANGPASPQAAAAAAAHRILSTIYPAQKPAFDAALAESLAAGADGAAQDGGVALGVAVADKVLALRSQDGSAGFVEYSGREVVGKWQKTAPMYDVPTDPHWKSVVPFAIASPDEFRPAAPPLLGSEEYAAALNETQVLGSAWSTSRTAAQTQLALFWADGKGSYTPPGHWNEIAASVAAARGNSLSANARLMAQLNVALADAAIACWDAKYAYELWRPETAIRQAAGDGNAATVADESWRPLLITPTHPEYVSGHSTFSAAAAKVLAAAFGDGVTFATTSPTLLDVTRTYTSFGAAAADAGRSRIYGGIHYEFSNQAGQAIGRNVADAVLAKFAVGRDTADPVVVTAPLAEVVQAVPTITGQVLDNVGVVAASYAIDGGAPRPLAFTVDGSFTISAADLGTLADGGHTVTIAARDAAGNEAPGRSIAFTLDRVAPVITLPSLTNGTVLSGTSRLTGAADPTGSALVSLVYGFDDGAARAIPFDARTGAFDVPLSFGSLGLGDHELRLTALDAAGNVTTLARSVTVESLAPFTITELTPGAGSTEVGVTQRPMVMFSRAVDATSLTSDTFFATGPNGAKLPATIVPAADGSYAWLFVSGSMPGGARITVTVDGSAIRAATGGTLLDADGDGNAGGARSVTFTTVSATVAAGTTLVGKVVDPGPDLEPRTFDDIRRGADGVIHTPDDVFLRPLAGVRVFILGSEDDAVYTDANGDFALTSVPAGPIKVAVDGRTATNAPSDMFFPEMVLDVTIRPGVENTLMGTMGTTAQQRANADRREFYLPRIDRSILQPVSATSATVVTAAASAAPDLTAEQRNNLFLTVAPGSTVGPDGRIVPDATVGFSTVPPELIREMLPTGIQNIDVALTIQAPGVTAFATPLQLTFPNVSNAPPGAKLFLLSFDHTTGRVVVNGTATVSPDGKSVVSDPDSGIRAPGWHAVTPEVSEGTSPQPIEVTGGFGVAGPSGPASLVGSLPAAPATIPPVQSVAGLTHGAGFDIGIALPASGLTPAQAMLVRAAVSRWEQVVVGDVPSAWTTNGLVDDLFIQFSIAPLDGPRGTLARTAVLEVRGGSLPLPAVAQITLDAADLPLLSGPAFQAVVTHEIAHALGFGTWSASSPIDTSDPTNPRFTGSAAVAAYAALTRQPQSGVPLDNRAGAVPSHWRESVFGNELLTPALDAAVTYAISPVTVAALGDLGYTVDLAAADAYALPGPGFSFDPATSAPDFPSPVPAPRVDAHLFRAFDFGPVGSSVAPGFTAASPASVYSPARGWGWAEAGGMTADSIHDPLVPLTGDHVAVFDNTFLIDVANGVYDVIVMFGDDVSPLNNVRYTIEGRRTTVSTRVGEHASLVHRVAVGDGQISVRLGHDGSHAAVNAIEVHRVDDPLTISAAAGGRSGSFFAAFVNLDSGFVIRDHMVLAPGSPLFGDGVMLASNAAYRQAIYHVQSNTVSVSEFVTPQTGTRFSLPQLQFVSGLSPDDDGDGLENLAEMIVGTRADRADSDGDGIGDLAELQRDQDPLDGKLLRTGIVATIAIEGSARAVDVASSPTNPAVLTAYVATDVRGLAIVDVSQITRPVVLARLELPSEPSPLSQRAWRDVAVDPGRGLAAVAADQALWLVDVSNPATPVVRTRVDLPGGVTRVRLMDGLAYVAHGRRVSVVDVVSGEIRETVDPQAGAVRALAIDDRGLYVISEGRYTWSELSTFELQAGIPVPRGRLDISFSIANIVAAGGRLTLGADNSWNNGLLTVDPTNLAAPRLISGPDSLAIGGRAVAIGDPRLAVGVGRLGGQPGIDVVDLSDPTDTSRVLTRFTAPALEYPQDVKVAGGLAYVVDPRAGLLVVNHAGFDNLGIAPTASIAVDAADADTAIGGVQVAEGQLISVRPAVADDVHVAAVELLVNGIPVASDATYPFEFFAAVPLLAGGVNTMTLQVRATDTGGNVGLSNLVTVDVVADTFAPRVASIDLADGDARFALRAVDLRFDEPLDATRQDAAQVRLVRAGSDATFGTADDVRLPVSLDVRGRGRGLAVIAAESLTPGDYRFTIPRDIIADRAGNVLGGDIVRTFTIRAASKIRPETGTAADPATPAANPGQEICFAVPFDPATATLDVPLIEGSVAYRRLAPSRIDAARGLAFFVVPLDAVTGDATLGSTAVEAYHETVPLQIVPIVTDAEWVGADSQGVTVALSGYGFVERDVVARYRLGTETVIDEWPNVRFVGRYDADGTFIRNGRVLLTLPFSTGMLGAISVSTAGGTSAPFTRSLASIVATAFSGIPADASLPSANPGQAITLTGSGLTTTTDVLLRYVDSDGVAKVVNVKPTVAAGDGTRATLILPQNVSGAFGVGVLGSSSQPVLQIVPVLTAWSTDRERLTITATGLVEGATTYMFPGATVADADVAESASNGGIDVQFGGEVSLDRDAVPRHGVGTMTVSTAGGTSAALPLSAVLTNLPQRFHDDVAVDAGRNLWVGDFGNPSALHLVNPATGGVIRTVPMPGGVAFATLGLQILPEGILLGGTAVAAGSLLVFDGSNQNDGIVTAIDPADGTAIASLVLEGQAGLHAGVYDPATGRIFVATQGVGGDVSRLAEIDPATGVERAGVDLPIVVAGAAGLAIHPTTGHLWLGSYEGGPQLIEYRIDGVGELTELRRFATVLQGLDVTGISGLAFTADGELWASTTNGTIHRLDLGRDDVAVPTATLTGVVARATDGIPADAATASANVGEVIELVGTNFGPWTRVLFATRDHEGLPGVVSITPLAINPAGTRLSVQVPDRATTGDVRVVNQAVVDVAGSADWVDAVYRGVTVTFTATGGTSTITFAGQGVSEATGLDKVWGIDNVTVAGPGGTTVFTDDFEAGAKPAWADATVNGDNRAMLSRFSGFFGTVDGVNRTQSVSLSGLTAGHVYTLTFDLYAIDGWVGLATQLSPGGIADTFAVSVDGRILLEDAIANTTTGPYFVEDVRIAQTFRASAGIPLQIVPTLRDVAILPLPGSGNRFTLSGSGFMEGATTLTVGGVSIADQQTDASLFYVQGDRNDTLTVDAPLTIVGRIRVTTTGGFAEISPASLPSRPVTEFASIQAAANLGTPASANAPSANTGQTITLVGQGFTNSTQVEFAAVDDTGALGVLVRTGVATDDGRNLAVVVPAMARTGQVRVQGSEVSHLLQVVPTLQAVGGDIVAGNTVVVEGTGLSVSDLFVAIDGRPVTTVAVRTVAAAGSGTLDQQLLTLTVPAGISAGRVEVFTAGGSASTRS